MKKEFRICKNYEFSSIIQKKTFVKSPSFVCYIQPKVEAHARIGISVGKKMGNAVKRNKIKRQLRSMIDEVFTFEEKYDVVIIVRPVYANHDYAENLNELKESKKKMEWRFKKTQ
ncbi:MAG: ribonuclease P protein component [Holdemanella sp.]|nr:ribonuclease P protein component [Holdemanella sp.]